MSLKVDEIYEPCSKCEFHKNFTCIIDNRDLYTNVLKDKHCNNFILKNLYSQDDVECILKEKRKNED